MTVAVTCCKCSLKNYNRTENDVIKNMIDNLSNSELIKDYNLRKAQVNNRIYSKHSSFSLIKI